MENQFLIDSAYLSPEALARKHRLENDPTSRTDHMAYQPGMEQISPEIRNKVMEQVGAYDYTTYTARDVRAALEQGIDIDTLVALPARERIGRLKYAAEDEAADEFARAMAQLEEEIAGAASEEEPN